MLTDMWTDLTDTELRLLTAAADGELSAAEARQYDALIAASPRAAEAARLLRNDAARLRRLPKRRAPAGLASAVLARLPVATPCASARAGRSRRPLWLPYAVAASALFAVSAASFWFFAARQERELASRVRPTPPVANRIPEPQPAPPLPPDPVLVSLPDLLPLPREVVDARPVREVALAPRPVVADFVGAGIAEPAKPLHALELRLPLAGTVAEFAQPDAKSRFAASFASDAAVRIDLFARNLPAGMEQLAAAARAAGVAVTVDAVTQDRIGKKVPAAYALLVEGLTPAELAEMLGALAKPPQPAITGLHAFAAGAVEQREWKELFGRDLGLARAARPEPQQSPSRPISDGTLGKLKNAVGRNPAKAGLVLTYLPAVARSAPAMSREIKAFVEGRGDRKAGTATAFLVVRPAAN